MTRLLAALLLLLPLAAPAETIRIASFNAELDRTGPGLMLRDIRRGDAQVADVVAVIARAGPDILALQGIDWDLDGAGLAALADALAAAGLDYPHRLSLQPNSGMASGLDLDGDGRLGGPGDSQGFGRFTGQSGIAVLSRFPIRREEVRDFSALLWRDLPGAQLPRIDGRPFPSEAAQAAQRLSSTAHWAVPVAAPGGDLTLLTFQAGPPVFDGPEDRNGLRNRDELRLWTLYLDGALGPRPDRRLVIAGGANLDPADGDGRRPAIRALLNDPRLRDPRPSSPGAAQAGAQGHAGPDERDTVDWDGPGRLRVDYVLPSADWDIAAAGVLWPAAGDPFAATVTGASRHRLVWVDLRIDRPHPTR